MAITTPRASRTVCGSCTTDGAAAAAAAAAGACCAGSSDCVDRRIVAVGGDGATMTGAGAGRIGSVLKGGGSGDERVRLLALRWRRRNSRPEGGGVEGGRGDNAGSPGSGELSGGGAGGGGLPELGPSAVMPQATGDAGPRAAAGLGWLTVAADCGPPFAAGSPRFA